MPEISMRALQMPESPIRKLVPYADAAKERGVFVYHLNIGQPDIPTPPEFWEAIRNANIEVLEYSHSAGLESYRKKLVNYYQQFGLLLKFQEILITTGGSEAIRFAFNTCMNFGDEVIIPEPLYANYLSFALEAGVTVRPLTTFVENNYDLGGVEQFEKLITSRTKAILICNPANPTGKLYSREELNALRDIVLQHNLFLIVDEVYKEFCYDNAHFYSALTLEGLDKHVILIDSISKRYSACGARIGCLISKNTAITGMALKYAQARLSPPTIGQIGAEGLVDLPPEYYREIVRDYTQRRNIVTDALKAMPGVICPEVSGAFYVMPSLPIDNSDKFCQWLLDAFDHQGATIMLAPGTGFYASRGLGLNQVRISYVLEPLKLEKAMECLAKALEIYPGRTNK